MEHLSNLTEQQQLEVDEVFAKKYAAQQEAERDAFERQAREKEERERTQAQAQGARSGVRPTADTVSALSQALSSGTTMSQATPEATSGTGTYRIVQQSVPAIFDGVFKSGEDKQQRVMVFQAQMTAFLRQEGCLDVVESDEHIKVGMAGVDHGDLRNQFGAVKVAKAERVWLYIMRLIQHITNINQMLVAGSPSEA